MSGLQQRIGQRLAALEATGQRRRARVVDVLRDGLCEIDGRTLINFGSNDYLGLSLELAERSSGISSAQTDVTAHFQPGATASSLVAGRSSAHAGLEESLATFEHTEAALLFPSGYAANLGVLTGLGEAGDAIFCDHDNHASLIDGARLSDAKLHVYRRDRLDSLSSSLATRRSRFQQVFLVTDGVFSMDGTVAPLAELCDIAEHFDASVIVDEAHATGVLGELGRGACEMAGVEDRVFARVGTMSKAMGGLGGFVAGTGATIELLRNTARSQFFSTALPPSICEAMMQSLQIIHREPERRERLCHLTSLAHSEMQRLGLTTVCGGVAPIIAVMNTGPESTVDVANRLCDHGFLTPAIRFPTVRRGTERLRLSFSSSHNDEQIRDVLHKIAESLRGSEAEN